MSCNNCKFNYGSYHCMGCEKFYDDVELQPFCTYCNHFQGDDSCNNCVWNE